MTELENKALHFWDGQRWRFCPQCQQKAFEFAAAFASQEVERTVRDIAEAVNDLDRYEFNVGAECSIKYGCDAQMCSDSLGDYVEFESVKALLAKYSLSPEKEK